MAPQRRASGDVPTERKRGRRLAVLTSTYGPSLLPFIALAALLALRASIVRIISDGERGAGPSAASATAGVGQAGVQAAPPPRFRHAAHCSNTCFKARDGVCDEGRPVSNTTASKGTGPGGAAGARRRGRRLLLGVEGNSEVSELLCDLGTDCDDCGPWVGTVPQGWDGSAGPVAWLRSVHNASVYVRRTATPQPFLAAITHHGADPDVSAMLWHYGAMEGGVTRILHHVLHGQCVPEQPATATGQAEATGTKASSAGAAAGAAGSKGMKGTKQAAATAAAGAGDPAPGPGGRRKLVVDVGANFGYYTVQAALYGCRVVAFEPVRKFRAFLDWSVHAAGVAERVDILDMALSDAVGPLRLVVPRDGAYWGLASVNGVNVLEREVLETITVNATTLDHWETWAPHEAMPQDLLLIKMDIEGWEANVLRGGAQLLARSGENLLLEYSPGIYERNNFTDLAPQSALPSSLLALARAGFSLAHLPLFAFAAPWPPLPIRGEEPLPAFEEVTQAMLQHDMAAMEFRRRMEVDPGGCALPAELKERFPVWRSCREPTYGAHPKGFRSAFGFNTNLWASRGSAAARKLMVLQGTAALFDEGQDMKVWTSLRRPGTGAGLINCTHIGSGHLQIFRCGCPPGAPQSCADEQALVTRLAAEGKMPFTG